jgi:hypothetical protein
VDLAAPDECREADRPNAPGLANMNDCRKQAGPARTSDIYQAALSLRRLAVILLRCSDSNRDQIRN